MSNLKKTRQQKEKQKETLERPPKLILDLHTPARRITLTDEELAVGLKPVIETKINKATESDPQLKKAIDSLYRWSYPPFIKTQVMKGAKVIDGFQEGRKIVAINYRHLGDQTAYIYDLDPNSGDVLAAKINELVKKQTRKK